MPLASVLSESGNWDRVFIVCAGITVAAGLAAMECVVVQDLFLTETAQRADVFLPAASSYEKDGTMSSTSYSR